MSPLNRRQFVRRAGAGLFVTSIGGVLPKPAWAGSSADLADLTKRTPRRHYDLDIAYKSFRINGKIESVRATAINGTVPGPLMHWREGDTVLMNVTNSLMDSVLQARRNRPSAFHQFRGHEHFRCSHSRSRHAGRHGRRQGRQAGRHP